MKMIKSLKLLAAVLCYLSSSGQNTNLLDTLPSNEFGFNASPLVANLLPFDENLSTTRHDNLIFFKMRLGKGKTYLRTAINLRIENEKGENEEFQEQLTSFKLGAERKIRLSKNWTFHAGIEGFMISQKAKTETIDIISGDFKAEFEQTELGGAGIFGIQWMVTDRIALGTEGYITVSKIELKSKTEIGSSNFSPNTISENKSELFEAGISLPRSILFSIYF